MPSFESLREEIREVFQIFDEDESGSISIPELARALYCVTGERIPRPEVIKLVTSVRDAIAKQKRQQFQQQLRAAAAQQHQHNTDHSPVGGRDGENPLMGGINDHPHSPQLVSFDLSVAADDDRNPGDVCNASTDFASRVSVVTAGSNGSGGTAMRGNRSQTSQEHDSSEGIDLELFQQIIMWKINSRSYQEELKFTFALLEDKQYPGFITKESLRKAAAETEEPLTEVEVVEMFDALVTGVPSAAVDFTTFCGIQSSARDLEDS